MRGKPLFSNLQYCTRCCMPETQEGIKFDEMGVCQACQSAEQKIHIDWTKREYKLREIIKNAKSEAGSNYDCIIPISGGKDSMFQLFVLVKEYGMKPLAVTFDYGWYSETGTYNLINCLEKFNVDHIKFSVNRELIKRLAKRSLSCIGDSCWCCHAGLGAFPLKIAVKFNIPLLIWGESIAEASARATYFDPVRRYDREYFTKVSAKLSADEMICDYLSETDLNPFQIPSAEECKRAGVYGIRLGDYMFWDEQRQTEFLVKHYDWKESAMEGTYKSYKGVECIMVGVHDFTCYLKRGYGRASFHASIDVRHGLLTREEGFALARQHDPIRPHALDYYLMAAGMDEDEFYKIMEKQKVLQLKNIELPVYKNTEKHLEVLIPIGEQYVEKYKYCKMY